MAVLLKEPWFRSFWLVLTYLSMSVLGVAIAVDPGLPQFGIFDSWVVLWVGIVTVLGGIIGAMSQFKGVWAFERVGIEFCGIGIGTCYFAVLTHWQSDPVILTAAIALLTALAASFLRRYYTIRGLDLNPFGHRR